MDDVMQVHPKAKADHSTLEQKFRSQAQLVGIGVVDGKSKEQTKCEGKWRRNQAATAKDDGGDEEGLDHRQLYVLGFRILSFQWRLRDADSGSSRPLWRWATSRLTMGKNRRCNTVEKHIANHADEQRVYTSGPGARHLYTQFIAERARFRIQIIKHFHVIRDKSNGADDCAIHSSRMLLAKMMTDIRFKPGLCWRSTTALVDQDPI